MTTLRRRGALVIAVLALPSLPLGGARAAAFTNPGASRRPSRPDRRARRRRLLRERDERVVGADLPRLPLARPRALAPVGSVLDAAAALDERQLLGAGARALVGALLRLLLRQPPRRPAVPGRRDRRAARGALADRGPVLCRPGGDDRRRPVHRRRRLALAAVQEHGHRQRPLRAALQPAPAARGRPRARAPRARRGLGAGRHRGARPRAPRRLLPALLRGRALLPAAVHLRRGRGAGAVAARPLRQGPANPLLAGNAAWQCPGPRHDDRPRAGRVSSCCTTPTPPTTSLDRRRSGLLDRIDFGADGWPTIAGGRARRSPPPLHSATPGHGRRRIHRPLRRRRAGDRLGVAVLRRARRAARPRALRLLPRSAARRASSPARCPPTASRRRAVAAPRRRRRDRPGGARPRAPPARDRAARRARPRLPLRRPRAHAGAARPAPPATGCSWCSTRRPMAPSRSMSAPPTARRRASRAAPQRRGCRPPASRSPAAGRGRPGSTRSSPTARRHPDPVGCRAGIGRTSMADVDHAPRSRWALVPESLLNTQRRRRGQVDGHGRSLDRHPCRRGARPSPARWPGPARSRAGPPRRARARSARRRARGRPDRGPGPSSRTASAAVPPDTVSETLTSPPRGPWISALSSRLSRARRSASGSPRTVTGVAGARRARRSRPATASATIASRRTSLLGRRAGALALEGQQVADQPLQALRCRAAGRPAPRG